MNSSLSDKRLWLGVLAMVAAFAGAAWWQARPLPMGPEAGFKNLLLVTFDTTRADAVGCYGNLEASTVNLDRMAKAGVLLERCFSTAPITLPSHASILTGMQPYQHGARNNGTHYVPEEANTLAEVLRDQDFVTGAVISAFVLDSRFGLDQGFDQYDDDLTNAEKAPMFMFRETKADDTAKRAREFVEGRTGERWFLWVHFFDPHANYQPPDAFRDLCPDSPYDGEIAFADAGLGDLMALMEQRGMLEETLVMMTSDHGEAFGDHGESTHGIFIYDATTHVPWIAMHPGLAQGKRVREVVSAIDIFPTALELLGISPPDGIEGRSLAKVLVDPLRRPEPTYAYSESMNPLYNQGWSDLRSVRDDNYRYIRAPREELYDVKRDSRQVRNIADAREDVVEPWRGIINHLLAQGETDVRGDDIRSMDPDARAALAALGYVWTPEGQLEGTEGDLPDPKDRVHHWEKAQFANQLVRLGQLEEAEAALREVIAEDPGSILPRSALIGILMQQDRTEEAYEIELETATLPGARTSTFVRLAQIEHTLGIETWRERLEYAKEFDPKDPLPWITEAEIQNKGGDMEGALALYHKALEIDDRSAQAWVGIGNVYHTAEDKEGAAKAFKEATRLDPVSVEAHYNLGVIYDNMDSPGQAERAYRKALSVDPTHLLTLVNLGNMCLRAGQLEPAQGLYTKALREDPEDFNALFNYGLCKVRMDDHEAAGVLFARAANQRPDSTEPLLFQAGTLRHSKEYEPALDLVLQAIAIDDQSMPCLLQASALSHLLGQSDASRDYITQAMAIDESRVKDRATRDEAISEILETL